MNPTLFFQGQTWDEYLASMRKNQRLMAQEVARCELPPVDAERWAAAEQVAHVLVFTDDACQDSVSALPPLLAIAGVALFDLRVLRRSRQTDLLRHLTGLEYPPVPTFFFYDAGWSELGRFVEMPDPFRRLKADPDEAYWLRDKDAYTETWWETEFEELAGLLSGPG